MLFIYTWSLKGKRHVLLKVVTGQEIPNETEQSISSKAFKKKMKQFMLSE